MQRIIIIIIIIIIILKRGEGDYLARYLAFQSDNVRWHIGWSSLYHPHHLRPVVFALGHIWHLLKWDHISLSHIAINIKNEEDCLYLTTCPSHPMRSSIRCTNISVLTTSVKMTIWSNVFQNHMQLLMQWFQWIISYNE